MAAPPGPAETSPPAANRAGLWRQNSELRERVASLEQEVQTLRRAAAARRLSSRSSGLSPAASSLGLLDRSSSGGVQAAEPAPTVTAPAAPTSATSAQLEQQLAEARCEAAVAAAGIAALTSQLGEAQQEAQQLRAQLGAAQDSLAQAGAERACRAGMAEATAERVRALEAQVSALLREAAAAQEQEHEHEQGEAAAAVQAAPSDSSASTNQAAQPPAARCGSPPARSASRTSSSPRGGYASSPREAYSSGALPLQASPPSQHATRIFNVALPEEDEEGGGEELRREVARLQSRLVAAEAELATQLAAKQQVQSRLNTQAAEMAALQRERELLQEQALALQQEVSAWQERSLLRGGASGAEVEPTLERSPSRTLCSRMRLMLGGSPSPASSACASPRGSPGAAGSRTVSPWVPTMQPLAEGLEPLSEGPEAALAAAAAAPDGAPARPLQEHLRRLQAGLAARQGELAAQEARLREQQAALAAARAAYEGEASALRARTAAAEAAACAVLDLHASKAGDDPRALAGQGEGPVRDAVEALYAQMWRERLGRQRAQAEATELRLKLSSQLAAVAPAATSTQGAGGGGTDAEPDDALLASLQAEMARNDCLADELTRLKAHQARLQSRAEQLEMQLAGYNSLLAAAEGVASVPRVAAMAASTGSPRGRASPSGGRRSAAGAGAGSPVQAAITALQMRRAVEEAGALREQLSAAQAEAAGARRRERESFARRRAVEGQLGAVVSGLATLQRLLERRGRQRGTSSATCSFAVSPKGADAALAALSALLRRLQSEEAGEQARTPVSPQASDGPGEEGGAASGLAAAPLPADGGGAEEPSDPLEQLDDACLDVAALLPEAAEPSGAADDSGAPPARAAVGGGKGAALGQEAGAADAIPAVWSRAASRGHSAAASPTSSPGTKPGCSPRGGSPSKGRVLGLGWCAKPSPQATLSTSAEGCT